MLHKWLSRFRRRAMIQREPDWAHIRMALTRLDQQTQIIRRQWQQPLTRQQADDLLMRYTTTRLAQVALAYSVGGRDTYFPGILEDVPELREVLN